MKNKVENLTPLKNKRYLVSFASGQEVEVCEDVIVKYRLVVSKEILSEEIEKIKNDVIFFDHYNLALRYCLLSQKSAAEIKKYLDKKTISREIITEIVNKLIQDKIIDDEKYSLVYTDYLVKKGYGRFYIKGKLESLGFLNEDISKAIDSIDDTLYIETMKVVIDKQDRNYQKYDKATRKLKMQRYLLQRGYEYELIFSLVNDSLVNC